MNPALHDCLDALARMSLALENGWQREASVHYGTASLAAGEAFPLDSPASEALGALLAEVGTMVSGAARAAAMRTPARLPRGKTQRNLPARSPAATA